MKTTEPPSLLDFDHRYLPARDSDPPVLLLLHGTGGDEESMLPIGRALAPGAALLSPRGKVLENGTTPRFFRRLAEGVFDVPDLIARTGELAEFLRAASAHYGFDVTRVVAVGYSNGANIAASLLLLHPSALAGAVLLRPMVPLEPTVPPTLAGVPVYVSAGRLDPMVLESEPERLTELLRQGGAEVTLCWLDRAGHGLVREEIIDAAEWLAAAAIRRP